MIKFLVHQVAAQKDILKIGDLAEKAGLHRVTVSKLWNNKANQVDTKTLEALCIALDCQPGELIERIPDPPEQQARA